MTSNKPYVLCLCALCALCALCGLFQGACTQNQPFVQAPIPSSPNPAAYTLGDLIVQDTFDNLVRWQIELETTGNIRAHDHLMEIDVPAGATAWFVRDFQGPVLFEYEARMVKNDPPGPNDRVSDLNCFWMAMDPREPRVFFDVDARTGAFETYDAMTAYYVGQGGNSNTTTRFRRYIGESGNRPLLPEHDLPSPTSPDVLLTPNTWQKIQLVACNNLIEYYHNGRRLFSYTDPAPYTHGHFGIRTTWSHLQVKNFKAYRLVPRSQ
jgi:hypothetical protein